MTLEDRLKAQISATGPITLADYMSAALMDPEGGYYTTRAPFGVGGDFVTAPEISQMFGELIGLCLAQCWLDQGAPRRVALTELGPGRGTLMADILRATAAVPGFHQAAHVHLVETSPKLRAAQAEALSGRDVTWCETLSEVSDGPLFLVANEFFDALPIRQFQRSGAQWAERHVGLMDGALAFGLGPEQPQPVLTHRLEDTRDGDVVEWAQVGVSISGAIADRLAKAGGVALIIDYGDWRSLGDTLQAVRDHQRAEPLETPGQADLTAHVDFEALARAADGVEHTRLCPQGVFLERLGITARAQRLAQSLEGASLQAHVAAHRRLTHPEEMGTLFKVLGLFPTHASPPPGLET